MWDPTVVSLIQVVLLFMAGAVILFLLGKMKDHRLAAQDLANQLTSLHKDNAEIRGNHEELVQQRAWYQALFSGTRDLVLVHGVGEDGLPGIIMEVNDLICARLGYSREELLQKHPLDIQDMDSPMTTTGLTKAELVALSDSYIKDHTRKLATSYAKRVLDQALADGTSTYDTVLLTRDGTRLPVQMEVARIDLFDPPMIMCVARDISHFKQTQDALQESQGRLREYFSCSPFGIAMYDASKNLIQTNRACLRMFGIPDQPQFGLFRLLEADFLPEHIRKKIDLGESVRYESIINFDDLVKQGKCVSTRKGRGHFDIAVSYMGYDRNYKPRGYLVQVEETTERRKLESDLRNLSAKGAQEGTRGSLSDMSFTDLIQILCAGGRTMQLDLTRNKERASLFVRDGNVIHCRMGEVIGEQAFYTLMQWHDGEFTARQCTEFPDATIKTSLMSLLMEGARLADEAT